MCRILALALGAILPFVGLAGIDPLPSAQAQQAVEVSGNIQSVDCQDGYMTLATNNGVDTVYPSNDAAVLINSTTVPFCSLAGYVGAPATVWQLPYGNQFYASQIQVTGPAPSYPGVVTNGYYPVPISGSVLGTVLVGGLLYLLARGPDGGYYRYPYYGAYYYSYYQPYYQPYGGYWPETAPILGVASAIVGTVLGLVLVNNLQYLLSSYNGQLYRYPYWGPYRQFYTSRYHQTYSEYTGPYVASGAYLHASVRMGEQHWDAPAQTISREYTQAPSNFRQVHPAIHPVEAPRPAPAMSPGARPIPTQPIPARPHSTNQQPQRPNNQQLLHPTNQQPQQQQRPTYQPQQQQRPTNQQPQQQQRPTYQPQQQQRPTYQPQQQQHPTNQQAPPPQRPRPSTQQCGGNGQPPCPK
jgi:hypothetical protein